MDVKLIERLGRKIPTGFARMIGDPVKSEVSRMDNGTLVCVDTYVESEAVTKLANADGLEAAAAIQSLTAERDAALARVAELEGWVTGLIRRYG